MTMALVVDRLFFLAVGVVLGAALLVLALVLAEWWEAKRPKKDQTIGKDQYRQERRRELERASRMGSRDDDWQTGGR